MDTDSDKWHHKQLLSILACTAVYDIKSASQQNEFLLWLMSRRTSRSQCYLIYQNVAFLSEFCVIRNKAEIWVSRFFFEWTEGVKMNQVTTNRQSAATEEQQHNKVGQRET